MTYNEDRSARTAERVHMEMPDFHFPPVEWTRDSLATEQPRPISNASLIRAVGTWFALIFGVSYVALPVLTAALGGASQVLSSWMVNVPAFVMTALVVTVAAGVARPQIRLAPQAPRDPVVAGTLGGLLTWALVHNISPVLQPFSAMGGTELWVFILCNVVEMGMLGMMLASFTRQGRAAFALGALVQLLMLGCVSGLLSVL